MKYLISFFLIISFYACNKTETKTEGFAWLLGSWERTNDEAQQHTYEFWEQRNKYEYLGMGITLQNKDTIFKENLKIVQRSGKWIFEVTGVNKESTLFEVTTMSEKSFVAENDENPFPKKIAYKKEKGQLNAVVSANETRIEFNFQEFKDL